MNYRLRVPGQFRPLTRNTDLRIARNTLREPLSRLAKKVSLCPSPECHLVDYVLGYSAHQLKTHIESHFEQDMSWENSDTWFIEHIVPVHELIKAGITDPRTVNALKNLRPAFDYEKIRNKPDEANRERRRDYMRDYMRDYKKRKKAEGNQ